MAKLSKEQIQVLAKSLESIFGLVKLKCDGYEIALQVKQLKMKLCVMTYVNGSMKGIWFDPEKNHPETKFLRRIVKKSYSAQAIKKLEKVYGKECVAADPDYKRESVYYVPYWPSGKAALNHLNRVCESIELID